MPYPTSLRIVNWIKWSLIGNKLPTLCEHSLAVQVRWLLKRIEFHIMGNHLFANAKALVFAGLFFSGKEADKWLSIGTQIMEHQLPEQVLRDGGNFERSPMYHSLFFEDVLDLINASHTWRGYLDTQYVANLKRIAQRMLIWLKGMTHPDDEISFFNDAAFGVAPSPVELENYAHLVGVDTSVGSPPDEATKSDTTPIQAIVGHAPKGTPSREELHMQYWNDSGYIRLTAPDAVTILDVAPLGPDYLPAHAHADTLSFELSIFRNRVVVNGGTSCYGIGPDRLRERQTVSHSTVEIDGESSSEVWSGFRVARRAYPFDLSINSLSKAISIACSHDGYVRLPGSVVHRREWCFSSGNLDIIDTVTGQYGEATARYVLHPDVQLCLVSNRSWEISLPSGEKIDIEIITGCALVESAHYAPEFGKSIPTQSLVVALQGGEAIVRFVWSVI